MPKEKSCYHWWGESHDFDNWETVETGDVIRRKFGDYLNVGDYSIQERKCKRCNYTDRIYKKHLLINE